MAELRKAIEVHSLREEECGSAETEFRSALEFAQTLPGRGEIFNLSLYSLAGHHVAESAASVTRLREQRDRSENEKQLAVDILVSKSLQLLRLETLDREETARLSRLEQAASQKVLDELVLGRHQVDWKTI